MVNWSKIVEKVAKEMADKQRSPKCYAQNPEAVAATLEQCGFKREIAGEEAFKQAVGAICLSCAKHLGILFAGANGVGKSRLMRAIYQSTPTTAKEWIDCCDADSLSWLGERFLYDMNVYIDDFGAERMLYGDKDVVGEFIVRWHRFNSDRLMFITTNLSSEQINERSGGRVFDRIRELCIICSLPGGSKRKTTIIK